MGESKLTIRSGLAGVALIGVVGVCGGGCERQRPRVGDGVWLRHAIDDSLQGADGVRLADLNGDGLLDIATPWEESGRVRVYLNPGPSSVKVKWPAVTVGEVGSPEDAVPVDLDGDGAVDVVSACEGKVRSIFVHWAPASPKAYRNPEAWVTQVLPAARGARQWMFCLPMQVDGRGGIDLVAGAKGPGAAIGWFESPPEPRDLGAWQWHPITPAGWIMSLTAADMDRDGDLDVVASDRKGEFRGCFWLENPQPAGSPQSSTWARHPIGAGDREFMFLTLVDLDQDGLKDVLAATGANELVFHRCRSADGPAWESFPVRLPAAAGTGKAVAVGDVDLDGEPDIVFTCEHAQGKSGVMWMSRAAAVASRTGDALDVGTGRAQDASTGHAHDVSGLAGVKYDLVELLDLDADGDLDIITTEESGGLGVIWYENPAVFRLPA